MPKDVNTLRPIDRIVLEQIQANNQPSRYELRQHFKTYTDVLVGNCINNLIYYGLCTEENGRLSINPSIKL